MQVFLTNLNTPVRCKNPNGTINLHYLEIWPFWSYPKFTTLFSYERASQKYIVSVIMGKTYTFEDLRSLIDKHLNSNDEQVALLYHNNGRVSWRVFPNTETSDISLSPGLLDILKLRDAKIHNGIITGQPINKASITFTFSDANMIFLTCDQIDDTYVNQTERWKPTYHHLLFTLVKTMIES